MVLVFRVEENIIVLSCSFCWLCLVFWNKQIISSLSCPPNNLLMFTQVAPISTKNIHYTFYAFCICYISHRLYTRWHITSLDPSIHKQLNHLRLVLLIPPIKNILKLHTMELTMNLNTHKYIQNTYCLRCYPQNIHFPSHNITSKQSIKVLYRDSNNRQQN